MIKKYNPPNHLEPFIDYIWVAKKDKLTKKEKNDIIMPLGHIDIIFNFGSDNFYYKDGKKIKVPNSCIIGQIKQGINVSYENNIYQIGISLTPIGFTVLFNINGSEISGKVIANNKELDLLYKKIKNNKLLDNRIKRIIEFFNYKFSKIENRKENIEEMIKYIDSHLGDFKVNKMAEDLYLSVSTLERHFKKVIGLTPKEYEKIKRFANKALKDESLYSYYDQSHETKESKKYTLKTPKELNENIDEITLDYFLNDLNDKK